MGYMTRDYELLRATTSTGISTVTNVQGATWIMFHIQGLSNATTPATSTYLRPEGTVNGSQWVNLTVLDMNNNVATTVVATDSIYRLGEAAGLTGFRLRVATFNGIGASISAVSRVCYFAG